MNRLWKFGLWLGIGLSLGTLLWQAGVLTVERIRLSERLAVQRGADSVLARELTISNALGRELASVRRSLAQRDSQLTIALTTARRVVVREVPFVPTTLVDTSATRAALTTLTTDLQQCRQVLGGTLTACEQFRKSADSALAVGASLRVADSTALMRMAERSAAITRSRDAALNQLARQSKWRTIERSTCAVSLATNFIQWKVR